MWGAPNRNRDILVNGQRLAVRENLYDFLDVVSRDSRWHESTRHAYSGYIFIDQICIDQSNVRERNHQVYQMRNIYRAAQLVVVWLGVESIVSRRAMYAIQNEHSWYRPRKDPLSLRRRTAELMRKEDIAIDRLSTHVYWSRLWIVQELFLARKIVLRWGRREVPLENAEQVVQDRARLYRWDTNFGPLDAGDAVKLSFLHPVAGFNPNTDAPMLSLLAQRRDYLAGWPLTWAKAAEISRRRECEDPRDQVYGLLGLMRNDSLKADYEKSLYEVFEDLVEHGISKDTKDPDAYFWLANAWRQALRIERHTLTPKTKTGFDHVHVDELHEALEQDPNNHNAIEDEEDQSSISCSDDDDSDALSEDYYERKCFFASVRAGVQGIQHEWRQKAMNVPEHEVAIVDETI